MNAPVETADLLTIIQSKPFLKWPGGKGKLLKKILPLVPEFTGTYHEPFIGGGAVFFALASLGKIHKAELSDKSLLLMNTYWGVAKDPEGVIKLLESCENTSDFYYAARAQLNQLLDGPLDPVELAALIIYLNKTCFNGLFRVNKKKGHFNAAYGKYKNPKFLDPENIRAVSESLKLATIRVCSFTDGVLDRAVPGDFVYFDPPYVPTSEDSDFTEYTADGFTLADHTTLRDTYKALTEKGVKVLLSNADVPLVRELYKDYKIESIQANRVINVKADKRGKVPEVLVLNY
jgi:DNA adenine methylase